MPDQFTRGDSLREYLTGAIVDGGAQSDPLLSLGKYRSSTEAISLGIAITNSITGVIIPYASGGNPAGTGILTAVDANTLNWKPSGASQAGPNVSFPSAMTRIVEAVNAPGQYLRIQGTPPFSVNQSQIGLSVLVDNFFGFDDVTIPNALAGISEYRATIIRNESSFPISAFQRWIQTLGTPQITNGSFLNGTGSGGTITSTGSLVDWPDIGWCQVRSSGGTLKEIVYYSSRTSNSLIVPGTGRALLGTSFTAGSSTDIVSPVPGVAIGKDSAGVQSFGNPIQQTTSTLAPVGIAWTYGITPSTGLQIGTLLPGQQLGIWAWRQIPAGAVSSPLALIQFQDAFNAY